MTKRQRLLVVVSFALLPWAGVVCILVPKWPVFGFTLTMLGFLGSLWVRWRERRNWDWHL